MLMFSYPLRKFSRAAEFSDIAVRFGAAPSRVLTGVRSTESLSLCWAGAERHSPLFPTIEFL